MPENLKQAIRKKILTLLRNQKEEERLKKSGKILKKLFSLPEFQRSHTILFYASFDGEVETFEMMKQAHKLKKMIALPFMIKDQKKITPRLVRNLKTGLHSGPYGIQQPKDEHVEDLTLEQLDLVIVPGVAFDKKNYRLGRGHGYYDRFLSRLPAGVPTIGLAYDFQIVDRLPHLHEHDLPVSRVIAN
ncbi:MAG: 5-formyltetrahydrofolate cyclo-ligase [Omnitrophica WOR_2 bacterium RIFCSPHIGHO2_01_FULL_48_9]|nr:MAG: 5-formyltetrahydrofolate cyclo-ligase [Omnitrophica WOR_2 bacterium RIFCSPHIGHO2_02_FULL_48_11]OGX30959.1 MAG: 5-formyltetrahydrofolate cyclo-ligase [Omnitrophica WOR_2 bacterium RIFCSPHIGHO2_01_FULL_48_9]